MVDRNSSDDRNPLLGLVDPERVQRLLPQKPGSLEWLTAILNRLLSPEGCPWDREQTLRSLKPFLVEEAYEVLEAIDEGNAAHHAEELGDVLFQIVFQARLGGHDLEAIILSIGHKLIRRHPHVFGALEVEGSAEVLRNWERIKQEERGSRRGLLDGIPRAMPAMQRTSRLCTRAAKVGFDWPDASGARAKVEEELAELDLAMAQGDKKSMVEELGDLLFAVANVARKLGIDPEDALAATNDRFCQRFSYIEQTMEKQGQRIDEVGLKELDRLWDEAKKNQL